MIARIWRGTTKKSDGDKYLEYLKQTGVPDYLSTEGNRGMYLLRRDKGDETEFLLISLWESIDVIRNFAGEDIEKASYYPEDEKFLQELAPTVAHYDVLIEPRSHKA